MNKKEISKVLTLIDWSRAPCSSTCWLTYRIQSIIKFFLGHGWLKCQSKSRLRRNCKIRKMRLVRLFFGVNLFNCQFMWRKSLVPLSNALVPSKLPRSLIFAPMERAATKARIFLGVSPIAWWPVGLLVSKRKHCIQNNSVSWIHSQAR